VTSKQLIRELFQNGWMKVRKNGGHQIMGKNGVKISVPVHGGETKGWVTKRYRSLLRKVS